MSQTIKGSMQVEYVYDIYVLVANTAGSGYYILFNKLFSIKNANII